MKVPRAITDFFSSEELKLLRTMGNRLENLSTGKAEPDDVFERRFVSALKKPRLSASGRSRAAETWRKYKALQKLVDDREFAQLKAQSALENLDAARTANSRVEENIQEITKQLTDKNKATEALVNALRKSVARNAPYDWSPSIFAKLRVQDQKQLHKHAWLFLLRERKWISQDEFELICRDLELWAAFQYDEALRIAAILQEKRKTPIIYPRHAALGLTAHERCGACGKPIIDSHCGCSE